MNPKRWFIWLCLAVIVAGEIMLFRANQAKDAAITARDKYKIEAEQARKDLEDLKIAASAATQGAESDRLRLENARLSQAVTVLKNETNRLQEANRQLTQQLTAVGATAKEQQAKLQQWDAASLEARAAVQQSRTQAAAERSTCIANLKLIDAAKLQWALVNSKDENSTPTKEDLLPYFKERVFPVCPAGGTYTINSVGQAPTCSIPGHTLPQ